MSTPHRRAAADSPTQGLPHIARHVIDTHFELARFWSQAAFYDVAGSLWVAQPLGAAGRGAPRARGLHSSTFQLNLSRF